VGEAGCCTVFQRENKTGRNGRKVGMVERSESGSSRNVEEGKAERSVRIKNKQESKDIHSAFL